MAEQTFISWTDSTLNFWIGCQKVSAACDFCYAEVATPSRVFGVEWGPGKPRRRTSESTWKAGYKYQRQSNKFMLENGRKRRVFINSLSDFFDNAVPQEWRDDAWEIKRNTPDVIWILLTKRPSNIKKMLPYFWDDIKSHVWIGTTCEDQEAFDKNARHLGSIDPAVRFISYEPALSRIDISEYAEHIDWMICGGESGKQARPMHPMWAMQMRDQCQIHDIAFHFKQWGRWAPIGSDYQDDDALACQDRHTALISGVLDTNKCRLMDFHGRDWSDVHIMAQPPVDCVTFEAVGKAHAGHMLDGITIQDFPNGY